MTRRLLAPGLCRSIDLYVSRAPKRSSASYQPPTVRTAGRIDFRCGRVFRAFQKSSYVSCAIRSFQKATSVRWASRFFKGPASRKKR